MRTVLISNSERELTESFTMPIESIVLRELRIRLKAPFETSSEVTWDRRILLVEVGVDGFHGWGEITAAEDPFYNAETTETAWHITRDFIVPLVIGRSVDSAAEIASLLDPIRGHEMAQAGVENAVWDLEAQQKGVPLAKLLGGTRREIPCGVSIGIQPSISALLAKIHCELRAGYQRIKLKIKPGKDVEVVAAVRRQYPDIKLMVDGNSAYRLEDLEFLKAFDQDDLLMIEQPLAWDDIYQHSLLQTQLRLPHLPRRVHSQSFPRRSSDQARCMQNHQYQTGTSRRTYAGQASARPQCSALHSGLVWGNAGKWSGPGPQHCHVGAAGVHTARGCLGEPAVLG